MSGIGFESGGLSLAHSLTRGLTAHPRTTGALHGEMVAFGTVVQVLAEGRPRGEAEDVAAFCRRCGLPATLADLGLSDPTEEDLRRIAGLTLAAPYIKHLPAALDEARLMALLLGPDLLSAGTSGRP